MEMIKSQKSKQGFTLIEMLVATTVLALIAAVVTQVFSLTTKSNTKTEVLKEVKQNGDFALELLTRLIRNAQSVTSPCSATGETTTSLTIKNPDGFFSTFSCKLNNNVWKIASSGGETDAYLTSDSVSLLQSGNQCGLTFVCKTIAGVAKNVKVSFGLQQRAGPPDPSASASANFGTSVILRN